MMWREAIGGEKLRFLRDRLKGRAMQGGEFVKMVFSDIVVLGRRVLIGVWVGFYKGSCHWRGFSLEKKRGGGDSESGKGYNG